jgi:small subunit ribosomal protein S16
MKPVQLNLDLERVQYWVGQGAQPTETVRTLIRRAKTAEAESPKAVAVEPEKVEAVSEAAEQVEAPAEEVAEESTAADAEEPEKA